MHYPYDILTLPSAQNILPNTKVCVCVPTYVIVHNCNLYLKISIPQFFSFYLDNMHHQSSTNLTHKECLVVYLSRYRLFYKDLKDTTIVHQQVLTLRRVWLKQWLHNCCLYVFIHKYVIDNVKVQKGFERIIHDSPFINIAQI